MRGSGKRLAGLFAATVLMAGCAPTAAQTAPAPTRGEAQTDRLVLLGTGGGPIARITRSQPANLLQVDGKAYLIDIGDGTARQLVRAGLRLNAIDAVFITHQHFDHTAGMMGFIALDWQDRRRAPVNIYGPPGTVDLVNGTMRALGRGEAIFRPQLPDLPAMSSVFFAHDWDVTAEREVLREGRMSVRAVENSHYSTLHLPADHHTPERAYSYRFDLPGRSIVFTGDTGPSAALERLAQGADVLVSEVIDLPALAASLKRRQAATGIDQQPLIDHMAMEHLTPENVGRLAAAAGVKKVVLTHFATPPGTEATDHAWMLAEIRKHFNGEVDFGEDLAVY